MRPRKRIRVLVVDDSLLYREVLSVGLATDPYIDVVATATDAYDARDKILQYEPDVMTCDVEMPRMNGIEFIRQLLPQYPLPVIVVSTVSGAVFDAMNAGAVDFVGKPDMSSEISVENFIDEMVAKVKIAAQAKVVQGKKESPIPRVTPYAGDSTGRVVAIGASTGGTEAIFNILKYLPGDFPGILIVQHIPPGFSRMFAERLNATTALQVKEAETGDYVKRGQALIAPGERHLRIKKIGDSYKVEIFQGEKVNGHRPSVDVLFESVAKAVGKKAVGLILTGMGYDGAKGLLSMKRRGARTIGQDERTSVVYGMPKVAWDIGAVDRQAPLGNIPHILNSLLSGGRGHG